MYGLITQICAVFIIITVNIVYFHKRKVKTMENDIFKALLIMVTISAIVDVIATSSALLSWNYGFVVYLNKLYFFILSLISVMVFYYAYYLSKGISIKEKKYITIFTFFICFFISIYFAIFTLDIIVVDNAVITMGNIKIFSNFFLTFWTTLTMLITIYKFTNDKSKKNRIKTIPIMVFVFFLIISGLVQIYYPQLSIITFLICFNVLVMFFSIENPDIKLIEDLNIARNQAVKASNAKTEFLSNMSHEIRTPLNAIVGFSQIANDENNLDNIKDNLNDILMASNMLLDIINSILDISKIEANKLEIINSDYQFKNIYDDVIKLAKTKIGDKDIKLITTYDNSIPEWLNGDMIRVKQMILNVLTNAIKYTDKGSVNFTVNCNNKNNYSNIEIIVEDTGQGIKKEQLNNLFTKFQRLNEDTNTTIEGTGLGLVITKKLVELMDGEITAESEFEKGSKFVLTIKQGIVQNKKTVETVKPKVDIDLKDKKVLIVDDNVINLKVASKLIEQYNVSIETCDSGKKCLDLSNNNYDIIFLDDMMPEMTGTETMKILKNNKKFKTPIVVLTANALSEMKEKYLSDGFDDYLAKPIDKEELNRVIVKFLH